MTKDEIVAKLQDQVGLPSRYMAGKAYNFIFALIGDALARGEDVSVKGFGTFKIVDREARTCRNPITGDPIEVPARKVVRFIPFRSLKDKINA